MEWIEKEPVKGDIIRTKVSFYYHCGIFADEGCVIQFGLPDNVNRNADEVKVLASDIYTFLNGGSLEVLVLKKSERRKMRSPDEIINTALSQIGNGGYNVFSNNCEHFVFNCAYK